jgi:phospholipid transport system substrate-binding protein
MKTRPLLLASTLVLLQVSLALAATDEADKRLHSAVNAALGVASESATAAGMEKSLRPVLTSYISFDAMTRRAVGPGWRQFSQAERDQATDLFTTLIIRTYSAKLTPGEQPEISFGTAREPAAGRVEVPTKLAYRGSNYGVTYRLEKAKDWVITDVVIEGVSLIANYRTQLDAQFKKGGAQAVISALNQSVAKP